MRGQRLFIRPIEAADHDAIRSFLGCHSAASSIPVNGLIGKLVGDLVAVVAMEITDDSLRIADIVVARDLRRKWIGRVMLDELAQLAAKMDRRAIVVDCEGPGIEFFLRVGFSVEGDQMVRRVG
jgi:GNAT superfamily N-acetyltransferase